MFREPLPSPLRQRGVSLVAAVVVMLLLAGVGAYALRSASTQHSGAASDILGARAYQAARSGIQWAVHQVLKGDLATGFCNGGAATDTLAGLGGDLAGFSVAIACTRTLHAEAGETVRMYAITATACNRAACPAAGGQANYVERELAAVVAR